jgi:hypothetical protein
MNEDKEKRIPITYELAHLLEKTAKEARQSALEGACNSIEKVIGGCDVQNEMCLPCNTRTQILEAIRALINKPT